MKQLSKSIGSTIEICRKQQGLSQGQVAERADLSTSYISLLEQGKRKPNLEVLERVAAALSLPLNILIFFASDESELVNFDEDLAEKLSLLALKLVEDGPEAFSRPEGN